jgi:hypothetical protein
MPTTTGNRADPNCEGLKQVAATVIGHEANDNERLRRAPDFEMFAIVQIFRRNRNVMDIRELHGYLI